MAGAVGRYGDNWQTPLFCAANYGQEQTVRMLLEGGSRVDVNGDGSAGDGATALLQAAAMGHTEVVRLLVGEFKADVDKAKNNGVTPLFKAAQAGHTEVVRLLVGEFKADVDKVNKQGVSPLIIAADCDNVEVVRILVNVEVVRIGADRTIEFRGKTALDFAKSKEVKELLS